MIPPLVGNLKKPMICWYQNDADVVLRVLLHDVDDYFLQVKTDEVEFSTTQNYVDYYVHLRLFGGVLAEETSHVTTGREVTIHLEKVHKWSAWPRLLYSTTKSPQIFADVGRLDTTKPKTRPFVWDANDFAEYKKSYTGRIMPDVPSSDEGENSEDEAYDCLFEY